MSCFVIAKRYDITRGISHITCDSKFGLNDVKVAQSHLEISITHVGIRLTILCPQILHAQCEYILEILGKLFFALVHPVGDKYGESVVCSADNICNEKPRFIALPWHGDTDHEYPWRMP